MFNGLAVVTLAIVNRNSAAAIPAAVQFYLTVYELRKPLLGDLFKIGN